MRLLLKHHRLYDDPYVAAADTMVGAVLLQHQCLRGRPASQPLVKDDLQGKILDYLNWHIHENIRVSQVATHLGYNEKYLSTLFTAMTGENIKHVHFWCKKWKSPSASSPTPMSHHRHCRQYGLFRQPQFLHCL